VFNAGGKEDPLEFDDDTVSDGEDDDVVHGSPAENTAGADSAAAVEQEEKRRKFAGMEDKNDSSWVFEDDSDELFVGDAFDDDGDDDGDDEEMVREMVREMMVTGLTWVMTNYGRSQRRSLR